MEKLCKGCGRFLDLSKFTPSKIAKDGCEGKCRECRAKQRLKYNHTCFNCGNKFISATKTAKFCSSTCQGISRRLRCQFNCSFCGKTGETSEYKYNKHKFLYCNQSCRTEHLKEIMMGENNPNYERVSYNCDGCKKEILVVPYKVESQKHIFCSNECYKQHIGKFYTGPDNPNYTTITVNCFECNKEFKRKPGTLSDSGRAFCTSKCYVKCLIKDSSGEKVIREKRGCPNCKKDLLLLPSQIKGKANVYCSRKCKNEYITVLYSGENHPSYNPNLTDENRFDSRHYPEYIEWRRSVYERDDFTCQCCGDNKGGNLIAHHIYNYKEYKDIKTNIDNGITLCKTCHIDFHNTFGYRNNNEEQLKQYFISNQALTL
jgi:endogenous inhibitor of DNA gyrase (YacG/DUF329 family)